MADQGPSSTHPHKFPVLLCFSELGQSKHVQSKNVLGPKFLHSEVRAQTTYCFSSKRYYLSQCAINNANGIIINFISGIDCKRISQTQILHFYFA